jgi:hypothetical protein
MMAGIDACITSRRRLQCRAAKNARWEAFESKIETRKRRRSWLAGAGYFFLGFGLAIAAWQALPGFNR